MVETVSFTSFLDLLTFISGITGGLWAVCIAIALGAIATFSLYFEYKEKAFVGGGLVMLTIGTLLSFIPNFLNPMWLLLFLAYTALMIIIARRASRE